MPDTLTGNPANVSNSLAATVNGATNASPIVIQTAAAHLFASGDTVNVAGVSGNTAANGTWTITVTDATHFSLNGSTGNAAYTSGGTATDVSLTPYFQIPKDGEAANTASIKAALSALADRTQFLNQRVKNGTFRLVALNEFSVTTGTWTATSFNTANSVVVGTLSGLLAGDVVELVASPNVAANLAGAVPSGSPQQIAAGVRFEFNENGGGITPFTDGTADLGPDQLSTGYIKYFQRPVPISTLRTVATGGAFVVLVNGYQLLGAGGTPQVSVIEGGCVVKVWRPN